MWGDELGKLHNIFIRYNFTCLVDGLQGDTFKINVEPLEEKDVWLTRVSLRHKETLNQMNNNSYVL